MAVKVQIDTVVETAYEEIRRASRHYLDAVSELLLEDFVMTPNRKHASLGPRPDQEVIIHPPSTLDASEVYSNEIDRTVMNYKRQSVAAAAQELKSAEAMMLVANLYRIRALSEKKAIDFLRELDATVQFNDQLGQIYEQSRIRSITAFLDSLCAIYDIGDRNIRREVARAVDRYPIPRRRGGFGGIVAKIGVGAKIGFETPGGDSAIDTDGTSLEPRHRFDGLIIGQPGSDDEFGDLTNGPR
jgi:hypothetical protein